MKHPELLFGFVTILGVVILATFFTIIAVKGFSPMDSNYLLPLNPLNSVMWFLLIGGTFSLIAGVVGLARQVFDSQRSLFAALIVISIPMLVAAIFYLGYAVMLTTPY